MTRSWLLSALVTLCAHQGQAIALARGRGCAPGQWPGPGSAPCTKKYWGSGHWEATPAPGKMAFPTPNPAGHLWPGCMCPIPMPGLVAPVTTPAPHIFQLAPPAPGEVEVLTVDVRLANRVRCDNVTMAKDIARILKVPLKRITVQPWSWSLPDPPQSNYLAFVQEDHERCGCETDAGTDNFLGYRKVDAKSATDGMMLGADTSVMTVAQYKAMQAPLASAPPSAAPAAGAPAAGSRVLRPTEPPPSRVQMLTRDPCLVQLLRTQTALFKKKLAFLLGVPEPSLIIDPPPVKGTVGLLQLDSSVSSVKERSHQVPVLAVQSCNLVELSSLEQHLSLIGTSQTAAAPSPANYFGASPAPMMPTFTVAVQNGTNGTNVTNVTEQRVSLVMKLHHLNYDLLAASWPLVSAFTTLGKESIGEAGHIPATAIKMALYPGSVVIEATITPPPGTAAEAVVAFLNGTVCNTTVTRLNTMMGLTEVMTQDFLECEVTKLEIEDPPFPEEEANRAWIAFWSVVVKEPFAQDGAWRLLKLTNKPMTEVSKLLPLTLARIPGLRYRGLEIPNMAIKEANETRLPPPEDKAVGFKLPNPYSEEAMLEDEMRRMKKERAASTMMIKSKEAMEEMKANAALQKVGLTKMMINQADVKFTNAARAHAQAIRAPNATRGPDIVPFEVLTDPHLETESPYPWRDQYPPPAYMLNLQQQGYKSAGHGKKLRGA